MLVFTNKGKKPARIGNIVVNLQEWKDGRWVTFSSDIADATKGSSASHAFVCPESNSEWATEFFTNQFSGQVTVSDKNNNSIFPSNPPKKIKPGQTLELDYSATFDPSGLPKGQHVRLEVIVSFGNACPFGPGVGCQDIDIDGSRDISLPEEHVLSIPTLSSNLKVPKAEKCTQSVVLTDTADNIQGFSVNEEGEQTPVSFSNFTTDIGNGSGVETLTESTTRTVAITITNPSTLEFFIDCASLSSVRSCATANSSLDCHQLSREFVCCPGLCASKCSVVVIQCGFKPCEFCTLTQGAYKNCSGAGADLLNAHFAAAFPSGVTIGDSTCGAPPYSVHLPSADCVRAFLQSNTGTPGQLTACLSPASCPLNRAPPPCKYGSFATTGRTFASQVLSLALNIGLDSYTTKTSSIPFSSLIICGLPPTSKFLCLEGETVGQILQIANDFLGSGSSTNLPPGCSLTLSDINDLVTSLNESFDNCEPGEFSAFLCRPTVCGGVDDGEPG